jgi:hypothetical protein
MFSAPRARVVGFPVNIRQEKSITKVKGRKEKVCKVRKSEIEQGIESPCSTSSVE